MYTFYGKKVVFHYFSSNKKTSPKGGLEITYYLPV